MALEIDWDIITPFSIAENELLLFYNQGTGKAITAQISNNDGRLVKREDIQFSNIWDQILWCNRRLLLYDSESGAAWTGVLGLFGDWQGGNPIPNLGAGWVMGVSDGNAVFLHSGHSSYIYGYVLPDHAVMKSAASWAGDFDVWPQLASGRDVFVAYDCEYREEATLGLYEMQPYRYLSRMGLGSCTSDFTAVAVAQGHLLFYDIHTGGAATTRFIPWDIALKIGDLPLQYFDLDAGWTHIIPTPSHVLFYAYYDGTATIGHIAPNGSYVHEKRV